MAESLACLPPAGNVKIHTGPSRTFMERPFLVRRLEEIEPRMETDAHGSEGKERFFDFQKTGPRMNAGQRGSGKKKLIDSLESSSHHPSRKARFEGKEPETAERPEPGYLMG